MYKWISKLVYIRISPAPVVQWIPARTYPFGAGGEQKFPKLGLLLHPKIIGPVVQRIE